MMDLSKDALALLESARRAHAAPPAARQRVRRRLIRAIAAGTVGTSAAVAKAAALSALGGKASVAVGAGTSITSGFVVAVVTGLALGMVAITPASKHTEEPQLQPTSTTVTTTRTAASPHPRATTRVSPALSSAPSPIEVQRLSTADAPIFSPRSTEAGRLRKRSESDPSIAPGELQRDQELVVSNSAPAPGSVGALSPSKASIARETDLLAGVHRALQQGRAATALSILNRYSTEFPAGELQEEAVASRVVALCDFGRPQDAERWRTEFFRRYPNSALSARVRRACQSAAGEK